MVERPVPGAPVRTVLSNATRVFSNPWLASWLDASRDAGLHVEELTRRSVLRRGAGAPLGAHLQWPEQVLRASSSVEVARRVAHLAVVCGVLRLRGRRVLWTAHNVVGHDDRHPQLERALWWVLTRLITDVHVMSLAGKPEVVSRHPVLATRRWHEIPHGDYAGQLTGGPDRSKARAELGLPGDGARVLCTIGLLRPYKGAVDLVEAFRGSGAPGDRLLLWGKALDEADVVALRAAVELDGRVDLRIGYVEPDDMARQLAGADLVVLPYRRVLNSGSAMLALSAGRRILVPETPTFLDLSARVGPGWVTTYSGPLAAETVERALSAEDPPRPPDLSWCTWPSIASAIGRVWGDA